MTAGSRIGDRGSRNRSGGIPAVPRSPIRDPRSASIEPIELVHRDQIERILEDTGVFRAAEVAVAMEVIDSYLEAPAQDYTALGAFRDDALIGYVCFGATPLTMGTWDLYWIAVAPSAQGAGVGSLLLEEVERRLLEAGARMLMIETSSLPMYEPTQGFYQRHAYDLVARVPEFYGPGDDRLILVKRLGR